MTWRSTEGIHIYWRDRQAGVTRHITAGADSHSRELKISGDGRYVAFISAARNLIADSTKLPASDGSALAGIVNPIAGFNLPSESNRNN